MTPGPTRLPTANLSPEAVAMLRRLGEVASARGVAACVVGGVVRDLLLGRDAGDLDVVVEERAEDFVEAVVREFGGTRKVYARFGTVLYLPGDGSKVDIATARSESYAAPGALPDVEAGTISADLVRRDFTLNAMAASILPDDFGRIIDEHDGHCDLVRGLLRVLHEGSFTDDPTRLLRAVRFRARFGFSLEPETERLLLEAASTRALDTVSGERIMNEIALMLSERDPRPALRELVDRGLTAAIRPCWTPDGSRVERLLDGLIPSAGERLTPLLALLEPVPPSCREEVLERLRAGRRLRTAVADLARYERDIGTELAAPGEMPRSRVHDTLRGLAREALELAVAVAPDGVAAGRIRLYDEELAGVSTELGGADLIALGFPEGVEVGRVLDELRRARLDGLVSSRDEEEEVARRRLTELDVDEGGT